MRIFVKIAARSWGAIAALLLCVAQPAKATTIANPVIWADIPDISIIQVDGTYYMASTTMHMNPGVPIMESKDLVNWTTIGYVYNTIANTDEMNLVNGKNAYGQGSWAASLRYKNGTYYVLVPGKSSGNTHLYSSASPRGPWKEVRLPFYHDPSLHLDDDGHNYIVYGNTEIRIVELKDDLTGVKSGGVNKVLIADAASVAGSGGLRAEGAHIEKIGKYYYVFTICWPTGMSRTEVVHRSTTLLGNYEGRIALNSKGVAQGSVIQAPDGKWFGYLFQDNGSVGRSPWIMPVTWENDWPIFNGGVAPATIEMSTTAPADGYGMVVSDDFTATTLPLEWQWNHNPVAANWSLSANPGSLRLTSSRVDSDWLNVRNMLTQRSYGPKSSAQVLIDVQGMKSGDVAGLGALQKQYGYVAVQVGAGSKNIVMVNASSGSAQQIASVPLGQNTVHLRIDMDFTSRTDKATFYYSLDGTSWTAIGNTLQMSYTLPHFMGYRFALFQMATTTAGGYADFGHFKIGKAYNNTLAFPITTPPVPQGPFDSTNVAAIPGTIEVENYDVGGEGKAYHDADAENSGKAYRQDGVDITADSVSGYQIGWTQVGEWTEYTVDIAQAGVYEWEARVSAGGDGAAFRMYLDSTLAITDTVKVTNTGDWSVYAPLKGTTAELPAGRHVLRLVTCGPYYNIDWIRFATPTTLLRPQSKLRLQQVPRTGFDLLGRSGAPR